MKQLFFFLTIIILHASCSNKAKDSTSLLCTLEINSKLTLPFYAISTKDSFWVINGSDTIRLAKKFLKDSVEVEHPAFNSLLRFKEEGEAISGWWYNKEKGNYKMKLKGKPGNPTLLKTYSIEDRWKVSFKEDNGETYPAIAIFEQNESQLSGTFLTETGDYRYLSGELHNNSLWLSTFDFAHAFLFTAQRTEGKLTGTFYSGHHYTETWTAEPNDTFQLTDALERIDISGTPVSFQVTDINSGLNVDLSQFQNEALIIQIFGSWCPNCYDESRYLNEIVSELQTEGVKLIGVGFERSENRESAFEKLVRYKKALGLNYSLYYGGMASKDSASQVFSFIERVASFPTLIFLDQDHKVKAIHSGFSGPATGEEYEKSKAEIMKSVGLITPK
ncbi:TlpA family protein disulfide reductase [bacterium]|nr:TlpA family protein disulfide reductase [bacterium]